jgi:hypothetical protein
MRNSLEAAAPLGHKDAGPSSNAGLCIRRCGGRGAAGVGLPLWWRQKSLLIASGACRDRTGDLRLAKPALSQLS